MENTPSILPQIPAGDPFQGRQFRTYTASILQPFTDLVVFRYPQNQDQ